MCLRSGALGGIGTVGGAEGIVELLGGVEEVDELGALGQDAAQEGPVILRSVGELDHFEVRTLGAHRLDFVGEHRLQRRLLRLWHPAQAHGGEPLPVPVDHRERRTARLAVPAAHRRHHPVERDHHRTGRLRNLDAGLQPRAPCAGDRSPPHRGELSALCTESGELDPLTANGCVPDCSGIPGNPSSEQSEQIARGSNENNMRYNTPTCGTGDPVSARGPR